MLSLNYDDGVDIYFICWEGVTGSNDGFVKKLRSFSSVYLHASTMITLNAGTNIASNAEITNVNEEEYLSLRTHDIVNAIDSGVSSSLSPFLLDRDRYSAQSNKLVERCYRMERFSAVGILNIEGLNVALSLRQSAIINQKGSSFQRVFMWMCENERYFSAAIIGLTLCKENLH